ncbi:DUF4173 domain-containing protein [Neobacillus sp. FSL H8-0543]|uniref:DUF4153 domain-containing protein n=1 Tax=Neobacillus sp. FSL H8-0543 TaxID=2954672 RepID=UPI0031585CD2
MERKIGKSDWIFLLLCLLLGIVVEESFFRGEIGISYLVVILAFYTLFFWRYRGFTFSHQRFGYLVLICIWLLSVSFFLNNSTMLTALNFLVIPGMVVFHLVLITSQKSMPWNKPVFISYIFSRLIEAIKYNFIFAAILGKVFKSGVDERKYLVWKKVFIGLLISIPVLFVVLRLLMSADTQFELLIGGIPQWFEVVNAETVMRIIIVFFYTFAIFGLLQVLFKKQIKAIKQDLNVDSFKMDAIIAITVLVLINTVYLLFTVVQFKYFFSGTLQGDFTYAEYARKGFFELLFVTLINLSIIIFVLNFVDRIPVFVSKFVQIMLTVLVLVSGVMLCSAFLRLSMYEQAYGFTFIRIMSHSFMIFLVVIFMYTLVKIWIEKLSLFHFYFISSLLYYTAINIIDLEKIIVTQNIERYEQSGKIDIYHLNNMSYSGVMGLIDLYEKDQSLPGLRGILIERKQEALQDNLPWQSYNLKREQANERLKNLVLE